MDPSAPHAPGLWTRIRRAAAYGWLHFIFRIGLRMPILLRIFKPIFLFFAWNCSQALRDGPRANARHLLGPDADFAQCNRLAKAVVASFYDFVCDIARSIRQTQERILTRFGRVHGQEHFQAASAMNRGVIFVTAHLGTFEVAVAELARTGGKIHVVYQRDYAGPFEELRSRQRKRLGLIEHAVDDGMIVWFELRKALAEGGLVLIQGDRVMPGQKGVPMPFMDGHILMPIGPVKLALATGAPILPVFSTLEPDGQVHVFMEPPITLPPAPAKIDQHHPAMVQLALMIQRHVQRRPEQWHILYHAFLEDEAKPLWGPPV